MGEGMKEGLLLYGRWEVYKSTDEINHIIYLFIRNKNAKVILPSQLFAGLRYESAHRPDDAVADGNHQRCYNILLDRIDIGYDHPELRLHQDHLSLRVWSKRAAEQPHLQNEKGKSGYSIDRMHPEQKLILHQLQQCHLLWAGHHRYWWYPQPRQHRNVQQFRSGNIVLGHRDHILYIVWQDLLHQCTRRWRTQPIGLQQ